MPLGTTHPTELGKRGDTDTFRLSRAWRQQLEGVTPNRCCSCHVISAIGLIYAAPCSITMIRRNSTASVRLLAHKKRWNTLAFHRRITTSMSVFSLSPHFYQMNQLLGCSFLFNLHIKQQRRFANVFFHEILHFWSCILRRRLTASYWQRHSSWLHSYYPCWENSTGFDDRLRTFWHNIRLVLPFAKIDLKFPKIFLAFDEIESRVGPDVLPDDKSQGSQFIMALDPARMGTYKSRLEAKSLAALEDA